MSTEKQVKMAAKLYEMRDTAKSVLGAKYAETMRQYGFILKQTAARDKKDVLQVAVEVCKRPGAGPMETILVMAAAVELTEASAAKPAPAGKEAP